MYSRLLSSLALTIIAFGLLGCGAGKSVKSSAETVVKVDPEKYYGTYTGKRIDEEASATPPSIEELIGSSRLTLHDDATTFTMIHADVVFAGEYTYQIEKGEDGKSMNTMSFEVTRIGDLTKERFGDLDIESNAAEGREPSTPEMREMYKTIMYPGRWRFKVVDNGFEQLVSPRGPVMYEFTRDDTREPLAVDAGTTDQSGKENETDQ